MNKETCALASSPKAEECHWDLACIYEVHDDPPKELLDAWQKKREITTALFDPIYKKIGKTEYFVYSGYSGTEYIQGKMKRLLFNDPLSQKAVSA